MLNRWNKKEKWSHLPSSDRQNHMTIFLSLILLLIKMCSFTFILKLLVKILKLELSSMKDFAHYSSYTDVNSRRLGEIIVYALIRKDFHLPVGLCYHSRAWKLPTLASQLLNWGLCLLIFLMWYNPWRKFYLMLIFNDILGVVIDLPIITKCPP